MAQGAAKTVTIEYENVYTVKVHCTHASAGNGKVGVRYNRLTLGHPQMESLTPEEISGDFQVDAAISMSSIDHDGLGRYGDPLKPFGDVRTMQWMRYVDECA